MSTPHKERYRDGSRESAVRDVKHDVSRWPSGYGTRPGSPTGSEGAVAAPSNTPYTLSDSSEDESGGDEANSAPEATPQSPPVPPLSSSAARYLGPESHSQYPLSNIHARPQWNFPSPQDVARRTWQLTRHILPSGQYVNVATPTPIQLPPIRYPPANANPQADSRGRAARSPVVRPMDIDGPPSASPHPGAPRGRNETRPRFYAAEPERRVSGPAAAPYTVPRRGSAPAEEDPRAKKGNGGREHVVATTGGTSRRPSLPNGGVHQPSRVTRAHLQAPADAPFRPSPTGGGILPAFRFPAPRPPPPQPQPQPQPLPQPQPAKEKEAESQPPSAPKKARKTRQRAVDQDDMAAGILGPGRLQAETELKALGIEREDGRLYTCPKCKGEKTGTQYPPSPWEKFLRHYMRCGWIVCHFCDKRYKALGRPHHMHRHIIGEVGMKPCEGLWKLVHKGGITTFGALHKWLRDRGKHIHRAYFGVQLQSHLERANFPPDSEVEIDFAQLQAQKMYNRAGKERSPDDASPPPPPAPPPSRRGRARNAAAVDPTEPRAPRSPQPIRPRPGPRSRDNSRVREQRERSASPHRFRAPSVASASSGATRCNTSPASTPAASPPPFVRRPTPQLDENYDASDAEADAESDDDNECESEDDEGP